MKKIAVGDLGEFWYGDYKEPFEQLEGAVPGYPVGVVLKDDDGLLLCAYCGKVYKNLGNHSAKTHGMSASEYKDEVGLLRKSALVSEQLRMMTSANSPGLAHDGQGGSLRLWPNPDLRPRWEESAATALGSQRHSIRRVGAMPKSLPLAGQSCEKAGGLHRIGCGVAVSALGSWRLTSGLGPTIFAPSETILDRRPGSSEQPLELIDRLRNLALSWPHSYRFRHEAVRAP